MRAYLVRRLLLIIPTLFILSAMVFLSVRFIPGDVIDALEGRMSYLAEPLDRDAMERILGLDQPVAIQYVRWLSDIFLRGTLGKSLLGNLTVEAKIWARVGPTLQLGLMALFIALVVALPVGVYSAIRQDTAADYASRTVAVLGLATPNFWLAIMVIIFPALWWDWSPPVLMVRFVDDPWRSLGMFLIPSIILGTSLSAGTMRFTRTMMLEVLRQDYVRTAWAKGLRERLVVVRHAIKNAMIPVVSAIGLGLPILVGGSVIIENIYNIPGMGQLLLVALQDRDYPVVSGINLFFGTSVILINLLIDLIYVYLDPRVRYH
ncbi:MAG: ABC transporter permease [Spirochaetaceae bacterium]|nr:ABC transporter permease [Spirochaetaceae bacterium]